MVQVRGSRPSSGRFDMIQHARGRWARRSFRRGDCSMKALKTMLVVAALAAAARPPRRSPRRPAAAAAGRPAGHAAGRSGARAAGPAAEAVPRRGQVRLRRFPAESSRRPPEREGRHGKASRRPQKKDPSCATKDSAPKASQDKLQTSGSVMNDAARAQLEKDIEKEQRDVEFPAGRPGRDPGAHRQLPERVPGQAHPIIEALRVEKGLST